VVEYSSWRKSSRSGDGNESSCVECRRSWRKSSRSAGQNESNCLEARSAGSDFQVRDSKLGHESPVFALRTADFSALLSAAGRLGGDDVVLEREELSGDGGDRLLIDPGFREGGREVSYDQVEVV